MSEFKDFLNEQLKEDEFRKEYDALQPEFDIIRAIVEARTSQNLTQKEWADGMGMDLKLSFVPQKHM